MAAPTPALAGSPLDNQYVQMVAYFLRAGTKIVIAPKDPNGAVNDILAGLKAGGVLALVGSHLPLAELIASLPPETV